MRKKAIRGLQLEWFGDELKRAVDKGNERAMWAAGQVIKREAQRRAPRDTGTLADSAYVETDKRRDYVKGPRDRMHLFRKRAPGGVVVAFAAYYANIYEDSGAAAHTIQAGKGKVLYIKGIGFRRSVRHPGVRRKPFLGPALEAVRNRLVEEIARELGDEVERSMPRAG